MTSDTHLLYAAKMVDIGYGCELFLQIQQGVPICRLLHIMGVTPMLALSLPSKAILAVWLSSEQKVCYAPHYGLGTDHFNFILSSVSIKKCRLKLLLRKITYLALMSKNI